MVQQEPGPGGWARLYRVAAGAEPTTFEDFLGDIVPGPAAIAVRNDGRVYINSAGFLIQEVR
jgi:hypothetical protein